MRKRSALSVLSALAASVPPCLRTSFEFTTPSDVLVRIDGSAVFGVFERRTTVYLPRAEGVTPSSRKAGFPLRLIRRRNEKTASCAVSGVPSAKWTLVRRWKTNVFASFDAVHERTSSGIGWARSLPRYVKKVS